uniref:tRNA-uridine aminocarboxypropyltransferase 1 n=1 Tax=Meloidogyne incognita TaxID=6306 RepID=A0A914L741_MELIC
MDITTTAISNSNQLFNSLQLASFEPIKKIKNRFNCKLCGRKRMYFCYNCRIYIKNVGDFVPKLKLPFNVDIIKHRLERDGKSTAVHAVLLAPEQTKIFDNFVDVPEYEFRPGTVILCPSKYSIPINQYLLTNGNINNLIVLDSTWNTIGTLKSLPQLNKLPWIHLSNYSTEYWRPQKGLSSEYLATIEAIYFACKEYYIATNGINSNFNENSFDNLLFWFYYFKQFINKK